MKKITKYLAALTIFSLILSLGACSGGNSGEETDLKVESSQNDSVSDLSSTDSISKSWAEKLEAGEEILVGFFRDNFDSESSIKEANQFKEMLENIGCTVQLYACEDNIADQIAQLENFITQGGALALVGTPDADALEDVCLKLEENGIHVLMMAQYPSYGDKISGGAASDWNGLGTVMGKAASDWIDKVYPDAEDGEIHAAQLRFDQVGVHLTLANGIEEYVATDSRMNIAFKDDYCITTEEAFTAAEEALTYDKDIRIFFCNSDAAAVGVSNYIMSQPSLSPEEFNVITFASSVDTEAVRYVDASANNEQVVRAVIIGGSYVKEDDENTQTVGSAVTNGLIAIKLLTGEKEAPFWVLDDTWAVNSYGFEYVDDLPENDEMVTLYADYISQYGELDK